MGAHVCLWKRGDSGVSRKSGNSKLQPDGPSVGTVMAQWSMKSDSGRRGGCGLAEAGRDAQPEVCKECQTETAQVYNEAEVG